MILPICLGKDLTSLNQQEGWILKPADLLELTMSDPGKESAYSEIAVGLGSKVCLDLGAGMFHSSDAWEVQHSPLFSPLLRQKMIAPSLQVTAEYVKGCGAFFSLHFDGNTTLSLRG